MGSPFRLSAQRGDCLSVQLEIAVRIRIGPRPFTQHVEGTERQGNVGAAARECRIDCFTDDECVPDPLDRLTQRGAQQRRDERLHQRGSGEASGQLSGNFRQQPSDSSEDPQPRADQRAVRPAAGLAQCHEPLGDELVGSTGVRRSQQSFRKTHEGAALGTLQRKLLQHRVDERPGACFRPRGLNPTPGTSLRCAQPAPGSRKLVQQLADALRLRYSCGPANVLSQTLQPVGSQRLRRSRRAHTSCLELSLTRIVNYSL